MPLHVRETGATFEDSADGLQDATEHAAEVALETGRTVNVVRETSNLDAVIDGWSDYSLPDGIAQAEGATPADFDRADLKTGIVVEMEHTTDPDVALEIAMSHLVEDPDYYDKLAHMEAGEHKSRLDLILDQVLRGKREVTIDTEELTDEQVERLIAAAKARGLHVSGTRRWILIRDLSPASEAYGTQQYLTSADAGPSYPRHAHCAYLPDPDGSGRTSVDADHDHAIEGGVVQPADDGHDHDLMPDVACPTGHRAGEGYDLDYSQARWGEYAERYAASERGSSRWVVVFGDGHERGASDLSDARRIARNAIAEGDSDVVIMDLDSGDEVSIDPRAAEHLNPGRRDLPSTWTEKDVRKYEHIKQAELDAGAGQTEAKRIAAATVNRDRSERGASE